MKNPRKYLKLAAKIARAKKDDRNFFLGAIAIRDDDTIVSAYNGAPKYPTPQHHCEARLCRKLDRGATVYLARTIHTGDWALAMPCDNCMRVLKRAYVKRVFYTIAPNEWGCIEFN